VEVGHLVLAIGSPFMLAQTVTHGIVSATGRGDLDIEGIDYQSFIQTDAPTNPGNSGGALVNTRGEVIGINTAIATGSGQFSGVAFATPSNTVLWAARGLISGRPLVRGYLGVAIRSLPSELATRLGLTSTEGVVIDEVTPDSPAQRGGLRAEDIVLEIDGRNVVDRAQFRMMIAELTPGTRHTFTILRGGERRSVSVTLGQQPDDF
jgi:S1-C subfamily serine protease